MTTDPDSLDGVRVLVVEDDFDVAEALRLVLATAGAEVIGPVSTVEAACELAKAQPLDAAVLDIALSPGTSAPVARTLLYRGCPFVFVTGFSNVEMLPEELPGHHVLVKPVDDRTLRAAIHMLVHRATG
ncbi:MAG: response regulator [Planctomycetes bacterium]|nr:response regulator [Planctomycetota bacterium]